MRFLRITSGGFGKLASGRSWELSPGLNLFQAPNESGKSTLVELITGLFYGFGPKKNGLHPYTPWQGGETGGELGYELANHRRFTLRRHLTGRGEDAGLWDEAGNPVILREESFGRAHLGVDAGVFKTVTRILLDDLEQAFSGNGKEKAQTQERLLGFFFQEAAAKGRLANPLAVKQAWQKRASLLFSRDKRQGKEDKNLLARLDQAHIELSRAGENEKKAELLTRRLEELKQELKALEQDRENKALLLKDSLEQIEQIRQQNRAHAILDELKELGRAGTTGEEAYQRALNLSDRIKTTAQTKSELEEQAYSARTQAREITGGRRPADWAQTLDQLALGLFAWENQVEELESLEAEIKKTAREFSEEFEVRPELLNQRDPDFWQGVQEKQTEILGAKTSLRQVEEEMEGMNRQAGAGLPALFAGLFFTLGGLGLVIWWRLTQPGSLPAVLGGISALVGAGLTLVGYTMRSKGAHWQAAQARRELRQDHMAGLQEDLKEMLEGLNLPNPLLEPVRLEQAMGKAQELADKENLLHEKQEEQAQARERIDQTLKSLGVELSPTLSPAADVLSQIMQNKTLGHFQRVPGYSFFDFLKRRAWNPLDEDDLGPTGAMSPHDALQKARQACRQADRLSLKADDLEKRAAQTGEELQDLEKQFAELCDREGQPDLAALKKARERGSKSAELKAKLEEVQKSPLRVGTALPDLNQAEKNAEDIKQRLAQIDQKALELGRERGQTEEKLDHLSRQTTMAQAAENLSALEQKRSLLAREYDTLVLADELLGAAMDQFRTRSQPALFKRAAKYLAIATDGAYEWLGSDFFNLDRKKEPTLRAGSGPGSAEREASILSRGARDQLYLCLRLALADEITHNSEPLPLILDDPLVNFDPKRLWNTMRMLAHIAKKRQVLFFTCHELQAGMLKKAGPCQVLDLI